MGKRILHLIDSGGIYGAEHVILNLSMEMLKDGKYVPIVGCIARSSDERIDLFDEAVERGIPAKKIVLRNELFYIDFIRAAFSLRKEKIHCIHSHGYKPTVYAAMVRMLTGIPTTATCHLWFLKNDSPLKYRTMVKLELLCYRSFPRIVAVSDPIKHFLLKAGVQNKKITVIRNGIKLDEFAKPSSACTATYRRKLGIEKDWLVVLNVGRLHRQKNQRSIIEAARILKAKGIKAVFLIIGQGNLRNILESDIREKDVGDVVKLLGFRKDTRELLGISDVFLLPSLDEGLPISLLEAMASKVPAVVTPVGNIPSTVTHRESAFFIRVNEVSDIVKALEWMILHPDERRLMAENAYRIISKSYSSAIMYECYRKIYDLLRV